MLEDLEHLADEDSVGAIGHGHFIPADDAGLRIGQHRDAVDALQPFAKREPLFAFQLAATGAGYLLLLPRKDVDAEIRRSEEHTSELQSLMRISYAVFCLKKKKLKKISTYNQKNNKRIQIFNITPTRLTT